jgi:hypothetical protein
MYNQVMNTQLHHRNIRLVLWSNRVFMSRCECLRYHFSILPSSVITTSRTESDVRSRITKEIPVLQKGLFVNRLSTSNNFVSHCCRMLNWHFREVMTYSQSRHMWTFSSEIGNHRLRRHNFWQFRHWVLTLTSFQKPDVNLYFGVRHR